MTILGNLFAVEAKCGKCGFWVKVRGAENTGTCHRYAPRPTDKGIAVLPVMDSKDLCGEFEVRESFSLFPHRGDDR